MSRTSSAAPSGRGRCTTVRERDAVCAEEPGELREHAGEIVDRQPHVAGADDVVRRQHGQVAVVAVVLQEAGAARPDDREQIADHRSRRLVAARAGTLQGHLADRVAAQHDRVEAALDPREGMVVRHERGGDGRRDAVVAERGATEQLDRVAELAARS